MAFFGAPWPHAISPCCKLAIPLLERNERVVSWIRPVGGGVQDQIPTILCKVAAACLLAALWVRLMLGRRGSTTA